MPDITLCTNDSCFIKGNCYRYIAEPDYNWQPMSYFIPDEIGVCFDFMPVNPRRLNAYELDKYNLLRKVNIGDSKS